MNGQMKHVQGIGKAVVRKLSSVDSTSKSLSDVEEGTALQPDIKSPQKVAMSVPSSNTSTAARHFNTKPAPNNIDDDEDSLDSIEEKHTRFTMDALDGIKKKKCRAKSGGSTVAITDYPEVEMIIQQLNQRVATLESMLESIPKSAAPKDSNNGEIPPQDPAVTVTITSEQQAALNGLSSNVRGLLRCLSHRHNEQQDKILLAIDSDDEMDSSSPLDQFNDSSTSLRRVAKTDSKKKLLDDLLGPELPPPRQRDRRSTLFTSVTCPKGNMSLNELTPIPKELILGMMQNESTQGGGSAAYLAHEYGGMELPQTYTVTTKKQPSKRTLKGFARAVSGANMFVSQVKLHGNVGKNELEYLPGEFTRLGWKERKRLAELLTWKGLKAWGFDAFEVEKLSTITLFRKSISQRFSQRNISFSDVDLREPSSSNAASSEDDVVKASKHGCPIVLIGWALLASPYSQLAMAKNVNDQELIDDAYRAIKQRANTRAGRMARRMIDEKDGGGSIKESNNSDQNGENSDQADQNGENSDDQADKSTDAWNGGYFLPDEFEVAPRAVCRFLRKVEKEYSPRKVNPYHNNIHAADVIQSTHALIQMGGVDMALAYTPLETYSILLAAALHDVKHPGTNNNYQVNKMTELSLTYNDNSVLENMHASKASHILLALEDKNEATNGDCNTGILGAMTKEQKKMIRTSMIRSILSTDMSRHFSEVAKMTRHVEALEEDIVNKSNVLTHIGGDKHQKLREKFLPFILHLADISNPTKPSRVSVEWADCVFDEFFLQGDKEAKEELPISPLCHRATTNRPEAQVGFMNFVVKPAFVLLARCLPNVESVVLKQLEENFIYWKVEKAKVNKDL